VTRNPAGKAFYPLEESVETNPVANVLPLLEQYGILTAWKAAGVHQRCELFVLLVRNLPERERRILKAASDLVLSDPEEVVDKLAELEQENRLLRELSLTDELTGLYNYRFFAKQLDVEMARTTRTGQACSLIMIDLDDFKQINDTFGHDEGNAFLVKVTKTLGERLRPTDIMCRYGGDEFAVIMPATDLLDAVRIAERLNVSVSRIPPKLDKPFSVSIGVAEYHPERSGGPDVNHLINLADKALYRAKERGKDGICYEGQLPDLDRTTSVSFDEKSALLGSRNDE